LRAATGHPLWTRNAAFPLGGPDDSTLLTYASNRLYFASSGMGAWNATAPSTVGALDARTGRGLWPVALTART
jgi:outer membrane protein assembly factor BamB